MFNKIKEKLKDRRFLVVIVLLFFVVNIFAIFNTFTEKTTSTVWDGTVATKFRSGEGTAANPYVIDDGRELAYFFKLINGKESEDYFNKFYVINNNIDLNGYDFSYAKFDKVFSGNINGNGYTIFNFKISNYSLDEETDTAHYNLFDSLNSASIRNINFSDITIVVDGNKIINDRPKEVKEEIKEEVIEEKTEKVEDKIEDKVDEKIEEKVEEKAEEIVEETASLIKKYNITFVQATEEEKTEDNNTEEPKKEEEKTTEDKKEEEKNTDDKVEDKTDENTVEPQEPTEKPSEEPKETPEEPKENEDNIVDDNTDDEGEKTEDQTDVEEPTEEPTDDTKEPEKTQEPEENKDEPTKEEVKDFVSNITVSLFRNVEDTNIFNISVNNIKIKYTGDKSRFTSSMFILNDVENNSIENINISGSSNNDETAMLIKNYNDSEFKYILYRNTGLELVDNYKPTDKNRLFGYKVVDGNIVFEDNYPVESVLAIFNSVSDLRWKVKNNVFRLENTGSEGGKKRAAKTRRAAPTGHASGTANGVVYVNDYQSDADYYEGLNYTYSSDGSTPTTVDKQKYTDSNLVYAQINYYSRDIDSNYTGYVSASENETQFTYYKVYPVESLERVVGGNTVTEYYAQIELIDNPWTRRPYNRTFNGWITDYVGAKVSLDRDTYQRFAYVPVTMTGGVPDNITINFYTVWNEGRIVNFTSSWSNTIGNILGNGYQVVNEDSTTRESVTPYYVRNTAANGNNYPNGAVDDTGATLTGRCATTGGCPYYIHASGNYNANTTYYKLDGTMQVYQIQFIYTAKVAVGDSIAGYFEQVTVPNGLSFAGFYDGNGNILKSGTCSTTGGCGGYYKLLQYYKYDDQGQVILDNDNNPELEVVVNHKNYYYLTTRDTNIVVMTANITGNTADWGTNQTKPFTFTAINTAANGTVQNYINSTYYNNSSRTLTCRADFRVENMRFNSGLTANSSNATQNPTSSTVLIGNQYNVKIGRNTTPSTAGRTTWRYVIGSSTSSVSSMERYTFAVESGIYYSIGLATRSGTDPSQSINAITQLGNDYDRVTEDPTEESEMEVVYIAAGAWSGDLDAGYGEFEGYYTRHTVARNSNYPNGAFNNQGVDVSGDRCNTQGGCYYYLVATSYTSGTTYYSLVNGTMASGLQNDHNAEIFRNTIKSGRYGTRKADCYTGVYVGGLNSGSQDGVRTLIQEGGWIYTITGGPLAADISPRLNNTKIYIKGGYADVVYGGAGLTQTYGNKIIQVTGGQVNYSVFGGSNGTLGSDSGTNSKGTIDGDSFVYVGGSAVIGDSTLVNNNTVLRCTTTVSAAISSVEAGSVFGIGNGRSDATAIGSMNNSNIIINGDATINRNVYGGGNFGSSGQNGTNQTWTTKLFIHGGEVKGSVYGGGNNNGAGSSSNTDNITITMDGGKVDGSVYGGSRTKGTVYGSTTVNILSGTIGTDVYGGGEGGGTNGTFVNNNVEVNIGDGSGGPSITGNVYGGSAYGTVNATSMNANANSKTTKVTVNNGTITGSVFGGAKGSSTYTPYVSGNITVDINDGTIGNVFGGFDEAGKPKGSCTVTLDGGTITNAYGGGNKTSVDNTDISLRGATVTNLYGGSNQSGTVLISEVKISSGSAGTVFGGNNEGGDCGSSNITMTGGQVTTAMYGGGNLVDTDSTTISITGMTGTIPSVYGGGNQAGADETNINLNGSTVKVTNLYGGSNQSGTVDESHVTINNATVTNAYGGNNAGGTTTDTNVTVNNGTVTTIYGGGNEATSTTTHVTVNNGAVTTIYGGGNLAACTTTNVTVAGNSGTIANVYGGGNQAGATTTNVSTTTTNAHIGNLFGGSNQSGNVTTSNVTIGNGSVTTIYGGNNAGGQTATTNVTMNNGAVSTIYGGGNEAISGDTNVTVNNTSSTISNIYGGGNLAATADTNVTFNNGSVINIFGGGNQADAADTTVNVVAANGTISSIYGGGNKAGAENTSVTVGTTTAGPTVTSVYGGSNQSGDVDTSNVVINKGSVSNLYGGNNSGGETGDSYVELNGANVTSLYGGGNLADNGPTEVVVNSGNVISLYGGGNQAVVESTDVTINDGTFIAVFGGGNAAGVTEDTNLKILGGTVNNNIYGGGNEGTVGGDTDVLIHNAAIKGSAYAGGNGSTAHVTGDTTITVSGTSVIGVASCTNYSNCGLFGGGNAAETGSVATAATARVNLIGGTVYGNVYGGANTSKVYGSTEVTIGDDVPTGTNVVKGDVHVRGTVFGGGEANASGSTTYDFSFISVTEGVTILINGNGYNNFEIDGSIFGSGNASSSEGASSVTIKNYGTQSNPQYNISLQRADLVTIDNSVIVLAGATDRTNEYSDVLFSVSRVTELDIKNNTTVFFENGANLLNTFKSLNADGSKATVTINETTGAVTKSTDNRVYVYMGRHLDIAKDQNATDMGDVDGMSFFGMFKYNNDDTVNIGIYDDAETGDDVDWSKVIDNVTSYVAGLHETNHDIHVDGFYTNFPVEETSKIKVDYITPTPPTGTLYMWIIGAGVIEYEVDLNASRYSTLGTTELSLRDFTNPNTTFSILGFDYSELNAGVQLIDKTQVKKIADTSTEADNVMGVSMETSNAGWLNNGQTSFITDPDDPVSGTTSYVGGSSASAPTVLLYLHHSKNIATAGSMGKVKIQLMSIRQTGPLDKETKRLIITINLSRTLYDVIAYEGSMTAGRRYEMFASTATNISSTSSISAYYALFATDENIYKTGYHRTLTSTFAFPENTKITMIDLSGSAPEYYYKVISASDYAQALAEFQNVGEVSYNISMFEAMGAENSGVYYNDATKNTIYYSPSPEYCEEEFIFIIDFADASITSDQLNSKLLLEMRNSSDATIYSVLAPQHDDLTYNIYANRDAVIDMSGTISSNKIYNGDSFYVDLSIDYTQSTVGSVVVYDTHYFDSKLGIKISLINSQGNVVTGTTLLGLHYEIDEIRYDPNIDGTARIKIADKVDSAEKWIIIDTGTSAIATGNYKLRIESFGSPDGIYYGLTASDMIEFNIEIINEIYGLDVETTPEEMIINSQTGKNESGENKIGYTVFYNSGLTDPNIRFKLYRRNYNNIDDTTYTLVDAADYFDSEGLEASSVANEYMISDSPGEEFDVEFTTLDDLVSGTYKMEFRLYDDTALIGTVEKYFVIK